MTREPVKLLNKRDGHLETGAIKTIKWFGWKLRKWRNQIYRIIIESDKINEENPIRNIKVA